MPPIVKKFSARKAQDIPYSVNPTTARTCEICQLQIGWDAERARIMTKYRTRQTHARASLCKNSEWGILSEKKRVDHENVIIKVLESERDVELQEAAKDWIILAYEYETKNVTNQEVDDCSEVSEEDEDDEWTCKVLDSPYQVQGTGSRFRVLRDKVFEVTLFFLVKD